MDENKIGKSTFFGLDENKAAALAAILPTVFSFVPYIGYFSWIIPIIAAVFERKSKFVRLCAVQSAFASVIITASAVGFELLNSAAADGYNVPLGVSLCGVMTSLLRVAALVTLIFIANNSFSARETDIPVLTVLAKKIIKYNEL